MAPDKREIQATARQAKREASYETLVRSAMRRFYEKGYTATRVEDIVAGTGYTSGAFYFHFKNKSDCFWHVVDYRQHSGRGWNAFWDGLDPSRMSLEEIVRYAQAGLTPDEGLSGWTLVMAEHFQQHRDDPEIVERFAKLCEGWIQAQTEFVIQLQQRGWVDRSRNPETLAIQLLSFVEGLAVHGIVYSLDQQTIRQAQIDGAVRLLSG
jgi:AcrR family transcriptional regulator